MMEANESGRGESIGEQNTQRLLAKAYQPEAPGAGFARQVTAAMIAARVPATYRMPAGGGRNMRTALVAAAAFIVLGVGVVLSIYSEQRPGYRRVGSGVEIDGRRYEPVTGGGNVSGVKPAALAAAGRMTARPEAARPETELAQVGQTIRTQAGQRRRVGLADGSVLYVNQNTTVSVDGLRRVSLAAGEVYLEVSPRQKGAAAPTVTDPTFVVKTRRRKVSALGTHFAVTADDAGTGVVVTQGVVDVDGTDVYAGEALAATKPAPEPAPRASFILDWIRDLVIAAHTPLVPDSTYQGGSLIALDPWGQEVRLALRRLRVDVYIEDGFARTTIDQTYFNNENWRMEGTFYFPLPADASLSRLAMYVDGNLMEGGMCERDEARGVYESIVNQRRDPALLEWMDGTTFKMRVFPLEGRQEKRIILSYTQRLEDLYGQLQYRFPSGHSMALVRDWAFHAVVKNGAKLPWASGSHELTATTADNGQQDLVLDATAHLIKPDRDVTLSLGAAPGAANYTGATSFTAATYEGQRYVMLRHRPGLESVAQRQRRDWVFLFESSAARDPLLARTQVDILKTILENAQHEDTFAVVTAGTRAAAMTTEAWPVTQENIALAVAYLEKTHLIGALDLGLALDTTAPFVQAGEAKNPYLVHLGAGQAVLGERASDKLVGRIPEGAHYVGIGVGKNWSRQFMKAAAAKTGGYFTQINPDEPVQWRAFDLVATLNMPRLLDVHVSDADALNGKTSFLAFEDSLAQGEDLAAIARFPAGAKLPARVLISGTLDGKPYQQTLAVENVVDEAGRGGYLPRMWAKLEIDRLLAENSEANKTAIIDLSKAMYVMSPYTSLLVLENEAMYAQYKVDRGRKDHWAMYPAPEKIAVVYEPDPRWNLGAGMPVAAAGRRLPAEQVLSTVLVRVPPQPLYWPNDPGYYRGGTATAWNWYRGMDADKQTIYARLGEFAGELEDSLGLRLNFRLKSAPIDGKLFDRERSWSDEMRWFGVEGLQKQRSALIFGNSELLTSRWIQQQPGQQSVFFIGNYKNGVSAYWSNDSHMVSLWDMADKKEDVQKYSMLQELFSGDSRRPMSRASFGWDTRYDWSSLSAGHFLWPVAYSGNPVLTYQRPSYNQDWRVFGDLLQYAPGMNTLDADVQATLEAEAVADAAAAPGTVEAQARALIDRARAAGWQTAALAVGPRSSAFTVIFDGLGRYRYERTVSEGLQETVVCDGKNLWHLYPELGVGASRTVSRFHQGLLQALVPWALASADDLAHGNDVRLAGPRTVVIAPVGADGRKDRDGKAVVYVRLELEFATEGRLAERRWVEVNGAAIRTLARETYSAQGVVVAYDDQGNHMQRVDLAVRPAAAPELGPDTKDLVVLPLPYRSRPQVLAGKTLDQAKMENWSDADALAVAASDVTSNPGELQQIAARFFAQGERRIGWYTLLMATGSYVAPNYTLSSGNVIVTLDPMKDFPGNALSRYFADQQKIMQNGNAAEIMAGDITRSGFMQRMAAIRNAMLGLQRGGSSAVNKSAALDVARACRDPYFGWAILGMTVNYGSSDANYYSKLAETAQAFERVPELNYTARYEEAAALYNAGGTSDARRPAAELFKTLYAETLASGSLPLIDNTFRNALSNNNNEDWSKLMRDTGRTLRSKYGPSVAIYHAWQLHQLGDQALSEELFAAAMAEAPADQRLGAILTGVDFLRTTGQYPRAARLLEPLLNDSKYSMSAELWTLAAQMASNSGMVAQGLTYQEKAMDIEYAHLPEVINLQAFRSEYSQAMSQYLTLAKAMVTLRREGDDNSELIARVVRTADRWRAVDPDKTACCQTAAQVFTALNVPELAWEYLTTPLAERSNEGQPWVNLAQSLRQQGSFALADRAYATGFDVEPTNAQILWDRAMLLQQQERFGEARNLFQQLANGTWEPRFSGLQTQAKQYLANH